MKYRVIIEAPAQAEIDAAYGWIKKRSEDGALRWHRGLLKVIDALETFPGICAKAPENEHFKEEIRHKIYRRRGSTYRILFTIDGQNVHVLHVRHGSRQALGEDAIEEEEDSDE